MFNAKIRRAHLVSIWPRTARCSRYRLDVFACGREIATPFRREPCLEARLASIRLSCICPRQRERFVVIMARANRNHAQHMKVTPMFEPSALQISVSFIFRCHCQRLLIVLPKPSVARQVNSDYGDARKCKPLRVGLLRFGAAAALDLIVRAFFISPNAALVYQGNEVCLPPLVCPSLFATDQVPAANVRARVSLSQNVCTLPILVYGVAILAGSPTSFLIVKD